jgi:hypothetical protein
MDVREGGRGGGRRLPVLAVVDVFLHDGEAWLQRREITLQEGSRE